jgi:hypothetical protein
MALSDDSDEDGGGWASADFFGLDDPGALRCFLGNCKLYSNTWLFPC